MNEQPIAQTPEAPPVVGPAITSRLMDASHVLSQTGDELREMQQNALATYADQLASWTQEFSQFLRERNIENRISDLRSVASRRPELFIGGLVVAGYAFAKILRNREVI